MKYPDFDIENRLKERYGIVAGIDEAGRGALAGPVVSAAVYIEKPELIARLPVNDSKKMSPKLREELFDILVQNVCWGIGIVDNTVIDRINILQSTFVSMLAAVEDMETKHELKAGYLLIDGNRRPRCDYSMECVVGGDAKIFSIAVASIIAKVSRDRIMDDHAKRYPEYKLLTNKGYGTKDHIEKIISNGPTEIHRTTFLNKILDNRIRLFT